MYQLRCLPKLLTGYLFVCLILVTAAMAASDTYTQDGYTYCMSEPVRSDTAGVNDPPHLKPLDVQTGIVGKPVLLRLDYCDPEGEAPGTIATNTPHGSSLPDNGDGTRTFFWVPEKALETTVVFTVYEESDRRIRTSISVPFIIEPAPQPLFAISPSPEIPPQGTSASAHFQISGQVMRLSGLDYPDQIQYRASNVAGIVYDQGSLKVDRSGRWQGQINLAFGLNQIELELDDLSEPVTINVTYNPGYTFSGLLELQPDVAYVNEPRLIHARIALNDPRTGAADVQLIDKASEVPVAMLTDDGDLSNGDDIESDGVYSALFTIDENEPVNQDFQVQVTLPNGQVARSEDVQVIIRQRLDSEEINNIVLQQSIFEAALATADEQQVETLLLSIVEELAKDPQVADVGINSARSGIWIIYSNGIAGAIYAPARGTKGGSGHMESNELTTTHPTAQSLNALINQAPVDTPYSKYCSRSSINPRTLILEDNTGLTVNRVAEAVPSNMIESSKVLAIAAQYWDWGDSDDIPQMQEILRDDDCFDVDYRRYSAKGSGSVEHFKNLDQYGTILISSHGDSFFQGVESDWQQRFGWNGDTGQVVVDSNMQASSDNIQVYEDDLQTGRLVLWGSSLGITPGFITRYSGTLPNSLVYMSICRGTWNATMATAFLNNGAGTFLGYDNYVTVAFCLDTGPALLHTMLEDGNSLEQAYLPDLFDPYATDVVEFDLIGANNLSFDDGELKDPGFEQPGLTQAWQTSGDVRQILSLGEFDATEGTAMAIISTGLGFTTTAGSLSQRICLCDDTSTLSFDWNFLSEEWLEYVGSDFQDTFRVTITDAEQTNNQFTVLSETIDSLAQSVSPVDHSFDQNDVYATGWRSHHIHLPDSFKGKTVNLRFDVSDTGDSIFDSAVLLDNLIVQCNSTPLSDYQ